MHAKKWILSAAQAATISAIAAIVGLGINGMRSDGLSLHADWSPDSRLAPATGESLLISFREAKAHFLDQSALFLDSRSPESFDRGHIRGAMNLSLDHLSEQYMGVVPQIPPDRLIITYCEGESCDLSAELARFLIEDGFSNVKILSDGWTIWQDQHLPIEEGLAPSQ